MPDAITTAKALGGGLPIGALITGDRLADVLEPGDHGSTFAGGPVGAAAALTALDLLGDESLLASVRSLGERLMTGLGELDAVAEVRGRGLMVGVTLADGIDAAAVRDSALDAGLVINSPGPGMLRFLPPLIVSAGDVDDALAVLDSTLVE